MKRLLLILFALSAASASQAQTPIHLSVVLDNHEDHAHLSPIDRYAEFLGALVLEGDTNFGGAWFLDHEEAKVQFSSIGGSDWKRGVKSMDRQKARGKERTVQLVLDSAVSYMMAFESTGQKRTLIVVLAGPAGDAAALGELTGEIKGGGIVAFTVAVGDAADKPFLKKLSSDTGGHYYEATDSGSLALALTAIGKNLSAHQKGQPTVASPAEKDNGAVEAKAAEDAKKQALKEKKKRMAERKKRLEEKKKELAEGSKPKDKRSKKDKKKKDKRSKKDRGDQKKDKRDKPQPEEEDGPSLEVDQGTPAWVWYAAGGGGGLLFLIILILIIVKVRRRGNDDDDDEEEVEPEPLDPALMNVFAGGGDGNGSSKGGGTATARFVPIGGNAEEFSFKSESEILTLGRKAANDLVLKHQGCSGFHAELRWEDGRLTVVDKGSTNGTYVNDQRITQAALNSGDTLRFDAVGYRVGGETVIKPASGGGGGGQAGFGDGDDKTAVLSVDDPALRELLDEPEATSMMQVPDEVQLSHNFCLRHKNRIAHSNCDVCTRPYCGECLVQVMGEEVCVKCRAAGHAA